MLTNYSNKPLFCLDVHTEGSQEVVICPNINLRNANYGVNVLSDCVTSYDKRKIDEMLRYYKSKGSKIICLNDLLI